MAHLAHPLHPPLELRANLGGGGGRSVGGARATRVVSCARPAGKTDPT
jgi:hypothetical protein